MPKSTSEFLNDDSIDSKTTDFAVGEAITSCGIAGLVISASKGVPLEFCVGFSGLLFAWETRKLVFEKKPDAIPDPFPNREEELQFFSERAERRRNIRNVCGVLNTAACFAVAITAYNLFSKPTYDWNASHNRYRY